MSSNFQLYTLKNENNLRIIIYTILINKMFDCVCECVPDNLELFHRVNTRTKEACVKYMYTGYSVFGRCAS